jgi:putative endonuclease
MYFVYILKSIKTNRFYTGVTSDITERLKNHNKGGTRSTKPYRPWMIVYKEEYIDKSKAYKREYHLKSPKGYLEKKEIVSRLI